MIEDFLNSLDFGEWQLFIAFIILLSNILLKSFLPYKSFIPIYIGILLGLIIWTWINTFGYVFIAQMLVIIIMGAISSEVEIELPPIVSIVFLCILAAFISYDLWNTWDKKTYQCRPPECAQKERVFCQRKEWRVPNGSERKEICKTEISNKTFSFTHCRKTSGHYAYGTWENQTCFDEMGTVISEYDMD